MKIAIDDKGGTRLREIWAQRRVPVVVRRGDGHPLRLRLPQVGRERTFSINHYDWIKRERRSTPRWNGRYRCWDAPNAWLNGLVEQLLGAYGELYLIQPLREQEKCAPACWNALGHECQCQCLGANHGARAPGGGWFIVSESFASRWGEQKLACRLMVKQSRVGNAMGAAGAAVAAAV